MLWKEIGVDKDSYICFFDPEKEFKEHFYHMTICGFFRCDNTYRVTHEGTHSPLFMYIIDGEMKLEYDDTELTAGANQIILIGRNNTQKYYCDTKCEFLFFHFDGKDAESMTNYLSAQNGSPVFALENAKKIYKCINEPIMKYCYQEIASDTYLSSIVYSALCLMQEGIANIVGSITDESEEMIERIQSYIKDNLQANITLDEMADVAGLSRYYFSRLFKEKTGFTPMEYVAVLKINYAKLILRTSNLSISQISEMLGYSSPASFINAFKARRGISPERYRRQVILKNMPK